MDPTAQQHRAAARHIGDRDGFWLRGYRLPPDVLARTAAGQLLVRLWCYDAQLVGVTATTHPLDPAINPRDCRDLGPEPVDTWQLAVHPALIPDRATERLGALYLVGGADLVAAVVDACRQPGRSLEDALAAVEAAVGDATTSAPAVPAPTRSAP